MTASRDRRAPPRARPGSGENEPDKSPGYAEDAPRDRGDAQGPHGRDDPPSPDEGGVARETDPVKPD